MRNEYHFQFKNRLVADLSWCIGSPPLLDAPAMSDIFLYDESACDQMWEAHLDWLHWLDQHPENLQSIVEHRTHGFLGRKFEALLKFWFAQSPMFRIHENHVVLFSEGKTTTELDFVVEDFHRQAMYHLEVACKFYLGCPASRSWEHWIGPNPEDRLDLKMERFRHQFREAKRQGLYESAKWPSAITSAAFFKGYFFLPLHGTSSVLPKHACQHALVGWYLRHAEIHSLEGEMKQWLILPKNYWMAPYMGKDEWPVLSGNDVIDYLQHHFALRKNAVLIIQVWEEENSYKEISRGFILYE
jgi:hypothetical protein